MPTKITDEELELLIDTMAYNLPHDRSYRNGDIRKAMPKNSRLRNNRDVMLCALRETEEIKVVRRVGALHCPANTRWRLA